ncbi:hypothetical protein G3480_23360 [Thiorhodococcus mannitoliphagus]|uniref:Uncharacterized protein n=1 Tax=Thiorhodococcus mannitoliphagus TaxID=329406 RepID=A0A6P1E0A0_9GAMM|nr:hypothetical protein [Thiorhodococcus mannitoliphagus]NEX23200.1 hypothetical protein [Thiorhodococcus mannitoliphagus]
MYRDPPDWMAMSGTNASHLDASQKSLRVEMSLELVQRLMEDGAICAADLHCLDHATKQTLQQLCLDNCARCLRTNACADDKSVQTPTNRRPNETPLLPTRA